MDGLAEFAVDRRSYAAVAESAKNHDLTRCYRGLR